MAGIKISLHGHFSNLSLFSVSICVKVKSIIDPITLMKFDCRLLQMWVDFEFIAQINDFDFILY